MRYDYICAKDHISTHDFPMGQQPDTVVCPECGEDAARYYKTTTPAIHMRVYNREPSPLSQNNLGPEAYM